MFPQSYANNSSQDYSQRFVYIYEDKLWIITDENKIPLQYTTTNTGINILNDKYQQKELITYIWWDVWSGGKTTSTWNVLAQEIESSLSGNLSCWNKNYNDYTLLSLQHNETQIFTKEIEILNGAQVLELTIQCNNGEFDTIWATENIVNTTCTTLWYIPYNNTCVENKCQNNPPLNATSTATSENHQVSWNYQETPSECSFECNINYTYNSWSNTCEADTRNQTCSNITTNATYNITSSINQIWNGTSWQPSNTSLHNVEPSNEECRFKCNSWFTYDIESNQCVWDNCITSTSWVHSGLMYSLASQSFTHGNSVTITSENRAFWTNPANGNTSANFTFSCNAWVISTLSTANNAWSCNSWHVFNNNYSSPGCTPNTYIVTFHGNGGTGFSPTTKTVVANTVIWALPSPQLEMDIFFYDGQ